MTAESPARFLKNFAERPLLHPRIPLGLRGQAYPAFSSSTQ